MFAQVVELRFQLRQHADLSRLRPTIAPFQRRLGNHTNRAAVREQGLILSQAPLQQGQVVGMQEYIHGCLWSQSLDHFADQCFHGKTTGVNRLLEQPSGYRDGQLYRCLLHFAQPLVLLRLEVVCDFRQSRENSLDRFALLLCLPVHFCRALRLLFRRRNSFCVRMTHRQRSIRIREGNSPDCCMERDRRFVHHGLFTLRLYLPLFSRAPWASAGSARLSARG